MRSRDALRSDPPALDMGHQYRLFVWIVRAGDDPRYLRPGRKMRGRSAKRLPARESDRQICRFAPGTGGVAVRRIPGNRGAESAVARSPVNLSRAVPAFSG